MLPETRPSKVGKWTEPARRVLRERYLSRKDGEVTETPEEMCWRVATSIAAGEARYGRTPAAVREIGGLLRHDGGGRVPAELPHAHERGQGQRASVLGLLRAARGRLHGGDLRLREGRGDHSQERRRDGIRVLPLAPEGRPRRLDRRSRVRPCLVPARVQQRDGGRE